jgi:signal transduction histidine kinase
MMPGIDGFETASLIRQRDNTRDVPIIFVSALDPTNERVSRAYALGAVDYVPGPASPDALRARVRVFVELHLKTRQLRNKSDQMEELCYAVAHDLRAPLRSIAGFCGTLSDTAGGKLDDHEKEYLRRICGSVKRMTTLTGDLLDFAKIQSNDLASQPVDLTTVARATVEFCGDEIKNACAKVVLREPLGKVLGNHDGLMQVLRNLLANAITYGAEGRPTEVQVFSQFNQSRVRLCVQDNGIGIAPEHTGKLFRMFERLAVKKREGTGLGLAIVKSGIERMGGKVGVESTLGQGSTFWVELPSAEG